MPFSGTKSLVYHQWMEFSRHPLVKIIKNNLNVLRNNSKILIRKVVIWTFHPYLSFRGWGTQKQCFISKTMLPWSWAEGLLITEFPSQILQGPPTGFLNLWALSSNNLFISRFSLETKDLCHFLHILKWKWSWLK